MLFLAVLAFVYFIFAVNRRFGSDDKSWSVSFPDPSTLVYRREDIQRIWEWEIAAGHYPSGRRSTRSYSYIATSLLIRLFCST